MPDLPLITAPNLEPTHGFTIRAGGVSPAPFASLNLGLSSGDSEANVARNRARALAAFGVTQAAVCACHQVHGVRVLNAAPSWFEEEADAMVTDRTGLLLVVSVADCLPLLFHDPVRGVVAAAHCGWRGTVARLAAKVVETMRERHGCRPNDIRVAIGPGISGTCYQVGPEVIEQLRVEGFPEHVYAADDTGRFRLDLVAANRWLLMGAGVLDTNVWAAGCCTYSDPARFYSYRRDRVTGRHWAAIRL